jgi:3'-phosphoadenosine 5'-phosphosulfate (PAPS) 3'-phosphatase
MASLKSMNVGLSNNGTAMNAQTEMTEAQRQFDNKLLRLIQQHFPNIPLHGEEADKNWTRWLNFARDCAHLTKPDAGGGEAELAAALADVMSWISNWTPDFIYDAEWPDSRERAVLALASYTQTQKESK